MVLAATNRPDDVDLALRRPGRFDRELEVAAPSPAARRAMLRRLLAAMPHSVPDSALDDVADSMHGFVAADIAAVCQEAAMAVLRRLHAGKLPCGEPLTIDASALHAAAGVIRPSGMREMAVEIPKARCLAGFVLLAVPQCMQACCGEMWRHVPCRCPGRMLAATMR